MFPRGDFFVRTSVCALSQYATPIAHKVMVRLGILFFLVRAILLTLRANKLPKGCFP
jgi:hypothetical protein